MESSAWIILSFIKNYYKAKEKKLMQAHTKAGGFHVIGIFTNRLPATPDNAPFTHSLFDVGELPAKYAGWEIVHHEEGTFTDSHPGDIHHEHAYERIIARKVQK